MVAQHNQTLCIKEVVAAVVVVGLPASAVACVPDVLDGVEGGRLLFVHGGDKVLVHLLAVAGPVGLDAQGLVEEVVAGVDDVHEVSDRARCVVLTVEVDVDAAGVVGEGPHIA